MPQEYGYIAYIDESGDPGLRRVKPIDVNGASEWLILSAVVIRAENEQNVPVWVQEICNLFNGHQRYGFHFSKLNDAKKRLVCSRMSELELRVFTVASNKKNMRGYRNPFAEKYPVKGWFYWWLTRLLLERVTHFVREHSLNKYGDERRLKIEFSQRGGMKYSEFHTYYEWLKMKNLIGLGYILLMLPPILSSRHAQNMILDHAIQNSQNFSIHAWEGIQIHKVER